MLLASTATDAAVLITAVAGAIGLVSASVVSIITALAAARQTTQATAERAALATTMTAVHEEVVGVRSELVTLNGSTVGQLADQDETRRISAIPPGDRTDDEDEHVAAVPPVPDGP